MHAANLPKGNFPRRKLSRGKLLGGNRPRDNYPGVNHPEGICPWGNNPGRGGGNYPVSNYLGGFPRGQLPGQRSYVSAFEVAYYQNVLLINKFNGKCNSHQMA